MRDRHLHSVVDGVWRCGGTDGLAAEGQAPIEAAVDEALLHGLFPQPTERRAILKAVGAHTLLGAIASILPLATLKAIAQDKKPLEKTRVTLRCLPITVAAPALSGDS